MSTNNKQYNSGENLYLLVPIGIFSLLFIFAIIRNPFMLTTNGISTVIMLTAPLILATLSLTILVMAGRGTIDLSIGPLISFVNVMLVQLYMSGYIQSPITFFILAVLMAIAYQLIVGLIIIFARVQPIIVALSGYLALSGLNLSIMSRPGGVVPDWMSSWSSGTQIFTPVFWTIVASFIIWWLLSHTALFRNIRLLGSDERAAYASGMHVNIVRLAAHVIGGIFAGLAALMFTSLIASGNPTQGTTYTLLTVTALVLGGARLGGGRGSVYGATLGALNIFLVTDFLSTFDFGKFQAFVTDIAYGAMLVISLLLTLTIPFLQRKLRNVTTLSIILVLGFIAGSVAMHVALDKPVDKAIPIVLDTTSEAADNQTSSKVISKSYSVATYALFIVIGIAILIYAIRTVFTNVTPHKVALVLILIATALGVTFTSNNTSDAQEISPYISTQEAEVELATSSVFMPYPVADYTDKVQEWVVEAGYVSVSIAGALLLITMIILIMVNDIAYSKKRNIIILCLPILAAIVLWSFFYYIRLVPNNIYTESYIALLLCLTFFIITMPSVQVIYRDITKILIVGFGIFAVCSTYFLTEPGTDPVGKYNLAAYSATESVQSVTETSTKQISQLRESLLTRVDVLKLNSYGALAYGLILIVLFHIFIRIAMGETSFSTFWKYWHIVALALISWCAMFYIVGIQLWKLITIIVFAIITAPITMHIISTYQTKYRSQLLKSGYIKH